MATKKTGEWTLSYEAPTRDYEFILNDVLATDIAKHANIPGYEYADSFGDLLQNAADFSEQELFPLNRSGDKAGLKFDAATGSVTLAPGFKEAYKKYCQAEFPAANCDPEYGGTGLPNLVNVAMSEFVSSANISFGLLPGLSHGAYSAIHEHGNDLVKDKFLPKMVSGEWSGAMALTEADAGSDLARLTSKAKPNGDGTFKVSGQKIFISCGDQDATDNIVHLVLARLPDAPPGIKGISLFAVPKYKVNADGSLGARNSLKAIGLEEKQGMHASPTCTMSYEDAEGYLVGEPHQGMKAMFTMMNEERLYVGVQGLGLGEAAYQNALSYAQHRVQGTKLEDTLNKGSQSETIIKHPDVRRMLLEMKSFTEGARLLATQTALMTDIAAKSPDAAERANAQQFVELMTPIIKSYLTDGGLKSTLTAQMVFGGAGYIKETGMAQYMDDARIAPIYEGTNGIQALDLVGRKLPRNDLNVVLDPIRANIAKYKADPAMAEFVAPLEAGLTSLVEAKDWLLGKGMEGLSGNNAQFAELGAGATDFLNLFATVAMGGAWLQQAGIATEKLKAGNLKADDQTFYEAKIATARFFQTRVLAPEHAALKEKVMAGADTLEIPGVYVRADAIAPVAANSNVAAILAAGPKDPTARGESKVASR